MSSLKTRVVFAAIVAAVSMTSLLAQAPAYEVHYLPGLGGNHSRGNSINNDGWIAGYSHLDGNQHRHAALWLSGVPIDLGALGSPERPKNSNVVWPVKNTNGVIVGISQTDSPDPWGENWSCSAFFVPATSTGYRCLGFVWENGNLRPLPTLGGTHGFAAAANNRGEIAGWAENTVRDDSCTAPQIFQFRGVVWGPHGNQMRELLPLSDEDTSTAATAINDSGQVVGISGDCDDAVGSATARHMVLWHGDAIEEIPNLGGDEWNTPTAINERGDVAGFSDHEGDVVTEAFLWTREGGLQALGFLYDDHVLSQAFGINEQRQVVGLSCSNAECRAFLWQNGEMYDLNRLAGVPAGELLTHAMDINDDGVITGRATRVAFSDRVTFSASPAAALSANWQRTKITLPVGTIRECLHPLGPGVERLNGRKFR